MTKIFITRYWPTKGIYAVDAEIETGSCSDFALHRNAHGHLLNFYHKKEYWLTEEEAVAYVEQQIAKTIQSLQKKLDKLKKTKAKDLIKQ